MRNLKKVLALVLVFAMMLSTCVVASAASFPDVEAGYQYTEAIDLLASLNILGGYEDGTFKPENNITRAEFAKVVYVIFNGMDDVNAQMYVSDSQFNDVAKTQWFNGHVNWASENSIVGGYGDGTFLPSNNVAVKEAIKMVVTAVTDKALTYPNGYIQEARALKLLEGVKITSTDAPATRGQVAQLAYNLLFTPSRLCLVDEGQMDFYGNEIYKKTAPVEFVFGLTPGENVTLVATYENGYKGAGSATLEEGQVELAGTSSYGTKFDYAGDANDLFGQTLKAYFNADKELVSLVSVSSIVEVTTADKLVGNGTTKTPYGKIMGEYITYDADATDGVSLVRDYGVKAVIEQGANGIYADYSGTVVTKEGTTDSYILLKDFYKDDYNNEAGKVTLIDTPDANGVLDGVVDTVIIEHEYTARINKYTASTKSIKIGNKTVSFDNAIGHEAFANADYTVDADPVYATYTLKKGVNEVYTLAPTTTVEGVLTAVDTVKDQVVVGGTTYSAFGTEATIFDNTKSEIGDTLKLYMSANGYVVAYEVTESESVYDLNLGKVIAASDSADKWGNNVKATLTVVTPDGTEKVLTLDTTNDTKTGDDVEVDFPAAYLSTNYDTSKIGSVKDNTADEVFFVYDGTTALDYTIVGQYIHYEVDDTTGEVVRVALAADVAGENKPSNSKAVWAVDTITSGKLGNDYFCYNSDLGFYTAKDKEGEEVVSTLGLVADNFVGMYYEENEDGELETAYYTASNIPTFAGKGDFTLISADDEIVAMLMLAKPEATADNKVLGIVTGLANVQGETKKNGNPTYRVEITMLVNGETQKYYTEDVAADKLPNTDWTNLNTTPKGIVTNQLAYLQLQTDGKVDVTDDNVINITYLTYSGFNGFAYATSIRGSYITATEVEGWTNPLSSGWTMNADGEMVNITEPVDGEVVVGGGVMLTVCDETTFVTIAGTPVDMDEDELFQETAASKLTAGGEIVKSDEKMGSFYIFAYELFVDGEPVDSDNVGKLKTVFVFEDAIDGAKVDAE